MTDVLPFTRTPSEHRTSPERRAEILAAPGFGHHFTDHMVQIVWDREQGWHDAAIVPYGPISLDPAATVLHYAQTIFEGLKAYAQPDGSVAAFRADANARRFQASSRRLALPELPPELFVESLRTLVREDRAWVPPAGAEESLYLRPFMFGTTPHLGVEPAADVLYCVIASPSAVYFTSGAKPVRVWISKSYVRAAPGGTGAAKTGGNYAGSLVGQVEAEQHGCSQVVWLDATERRYVEEMGGMNLAFVLGEGPSARVVTPQLTGTLLPGVTRDSLLQIATDLGYGVEERRISVEEWEQGVRGGAITETFACGTAAVVTPVGSVVSDETSFEIGDGEPGPVTLRLRDALTAVQRGLAEDPHGWRTPLA
ncbi:MAG: branched-chain amino acid aminotransferase [Candidatus Dormiibacterota bacterium]